MLRAARRALREEIPRRVTLLQAAADEAFEWGMDQRVDESVYQRIYLKTQEQLLALFRAERKTPQGTAIGFEELREFTYWLFKYRLNACDPSKVGYDTTLGLRRLQALDALRTRSVVREPEPAAPAEFVDVPNWAVR